MSAFIQSKAHIDALIRLALDGPAHPGVRWDPRWYFYHDGTAYYVTPETADMLGGALVAENYASVNYRYSENDAPEAYTYARGSRALTLVEGFKALDGYEYQACEHPGWETSLAHTFVNALRSNLWRVLPGYDGADGWAL